MSTMRPSLVAATTLTFLTSARLFASSLLGTQVTGALYFTGYAPNFFDPANGRVPAGYLNAAGPTVTISSNAVEFGYSDGTATITADFSDMELLVTDHAMVTGSYNPIQLVFSNSAFSSLATASDSFPAGGMSSSLNGSVITLNWAGGSLSSGERPQALFYVNLPPAPLLSIQPTSTNAVVLSWPASSTGYTLQQTSDLTAADWASVTNKPAVVNGHNQVIVSTPAAMQFYRLKFP